MTEITFPKLFWSFLIFLERATTVASLIAQLFRKRLILNPALANIFLSLSVAQFYAIIYQSPSHLTLMVQSSTLQCQYRFFPLKWLKSFSVIYFNAVLMRNDCFPFSYPFRLVHFTLCDHRFDVDVASSQLLTFCRALFRRPGATGGNWEDFFR